MPIPSNETPTLEEVRFQGQTLGTISRELSPTSNLRSGSGVHLDPDLNREALPRQQGWLPCFGQVGSAQSHLKNQKVREGDLFLFFGWFRKVIQVDGRYCYDPAADDIQALFGWLWGGAGFLGHQFGVKSPSKEIEHDNKEQQERNG